MKKIILISQVAVVLLILVLVIFVQKSYGDEEVNLQRYTESDSTRTLPLLIMFSSRHCDYCTFIKREFLQPMQKSGEYDDKVRITVIEDDIGDEIIDYDGSTIPTEDFADRYSIVFTPTILFTNENGQEIGQRVVGLGNLEYFGGDLDEAIEIAIKQIKDN